jgi:hypothetical protein
LDEHGSVTGIVKMTWTGAPALTWRTRYLVGDRTSLQHDLHDSLERLLPSGMDIQVGAIENLEDYEQPLTVSFDVKGPIGSLTGKRLLLPGDIFEANEKPAFPHEKRQTAVFFDYAHMVQDATRIIFPTGLAVESAPAAGSIPFQKFAAYSLNTSMTPNSVTVRRDYLLGNIFYKTEEYADLRTFYNKFETKDQEPTVLKTVAPAANAAGN